MSFLSSYREAEALTGTAFDARIADGTVKIQLDTVTRLDGGIRPEGDSFSLLFSSSTDSAFGQGTVALAHPNKNGEEALVFLVPIGRNGDRMLYEAVFN